MTKILSETLDPSSKQLELVLDNIPQGVIGHDRHRRILYFNREAERITGFQREEVLGRDCHQVFDGPLCGRLCSFCGKAPAPWSRKSYNTRLITRDGRELELKMSVSAMIDDAGRLSGVLSLFTPIDKPRGAAAPEAPTRFCGIVGGDALMIEVFDQIQEVAGQEYPVHISGETGTGKELVARAIHANSGRRDGPFVPVNCGALPEGILESELFGHVRGAFTGAVRDKKGRFDLAAGGTLFLDEVADLPKPMQVKLLRVLQEGTFEPVGGEKTLRADVRIISACNRELRQEVKASRFRADLYYRLRVFPINLPPLRQRLGDIPLLIEHFLESSNRDGPCRAQLTRKALEGMLAYPWPGNVRELQSALHYALIKSRGGIIRGEHLPPEVQRSRPPRGPRPKLDRQRVGEAIEQAGGNKTKAAKLLGVGRATLYRYLNRAEDVS